MGEGLRRVGTARRVGANCSVVFHSVRCAGCKGRCGLSVGEAVELPVARDLPDGATVEVVASPRDLARRALGVFGWPLGASVAAAAVVHWFGVGEAMIVAALLGTAVAVVGIRAFAGSDGVLGRRFRRCAAPDEGMRVVLG